MNEPMKTAEEILRAKFSGLSHKIVTPVHPVQKTLIVAAMQEYADQEKSAERDRIKTELKEKLNGNFKMSLQRAARIQQYLPKNEILELIDSL